MGIGEPGTAIIFPALAAAIHAATGVRLRSHPFYKHELLLNKRSTASSDAAIVGGIAVAAGAAAVATHFVRRSRNTKFSTPGDRE